MKAAIVEQGKMVTIREIQRPDLPDGGALIRVTGCGLCGSDLDKLLHRTLHEGAILGHEVVGRIDALSPDARYRFPHLQKGQRVSVAHHIPCQQCYYCLHGSPSMCRAFKESNIIPGGFSEYIAISPSHLAHTVFPIPDKISDRVASCIEPLACCIRALDRVPPGIGNQALIMGLGFIGLLASQCLQHRRFKTYGADLRADRVSLAQEHCGIDEASTEQEEILDRLLLQSEGRGVDLVFLSVVTPETLALAFKAIRDGGTLLLFTSYSKGESLINQDELYFRELTVITSYSSSPQHLQRAYEQIINGDIMVEPLVTHTYPLEALALALEEYRSGNALKIFIAV